MKRGAQRYCCKACGRYCTDKPPKFTAQTRAMAVQMYLNSVGIRSIGRVLKASPATVLNWIRKEHAAIEQQLAQQFRSTPSDQPDIIEMDEIYTYVQKKAAGASLDRL